MQNRRQILASLVLHLRADHLALEGIFRISGSLAEINAWKEAFDRGISLAAVVYHDLCER
jgi:hypothetical protein